MEEETESKTRGKYDLREYNFGQEGEIVESGDDLDKLKDFKESITGGLSKRGASYVIEQDGKPLEEQQSEMTYDYSEGTGAEPGQERV